MLKTRNRWLGLSAALLALMLVSAACSKKAATGSGSGGMTLKISSPADGASVTNPLTITLDSSVALGDPSTGDHHVHICIDVTSCGSNYTLAYANSVQIPGLTPGKHTILASLRNADHSDAGVNATIITVTVTGGMGGSSGSPSASASGGGGYGY
jgi:hypothetical protein